MTRFVVTVSSDDTIETIVESFEQAGVHHPARYWTTGPAIVW
jgi:predicted transcriptional regulator